MSNWRKYLGELEMPNNYESYQKVRKNSIRRGQTMKDKKNDYRRDKRVTEDWN